MKPIVLQGHSRPIKDVKFSKAGDLLFTGSIDRLLSIWTTETGERIGTFTQSAAVSNFCVTKDSRFIVSGDTTGTIYLWDVYAGKKIREFEGDPTMSIKSIDLSNSDEKVSFVFSGRSKTSKSYVETYKMIDLLTLSDPESLKKSVENVIESSTSKFTSAKFSEINKKFFISKEDGSMDLFDINDKKTVMTKKFHEDTIIDFDLSPIHDVFITASRDGKSHVISSDNFEIINTFLPEKPTRNLNACKISPNFLLKDESNNNKIKFNFMIAGGQESKDVTTTHTNAGGFEVMFYNIMYREEIGSVSGHFGPVNTLAFSGDGKCFASGGEDATIRLYRLTDDFFSLNK
jgi:translation initiation factor 3 subunit I